MAARSADRPVIFLDVDGTLIPFSPRPARRRRPASADGGGGGNPLLARLDPEDGRRLLGLGGDLAWATTWMEHANEIIAPRLGLPRLPVIDDPGPGQGQPRGLHWKTMPLIRWAAGRTFVWLDDEKTDADRQWAAAHHDGKALLHRVDPHRGLTEEDIALVRKWLAQ